MNRREFISWVGVGSIASSLPLALAATQDIQSAAQAAEQSDGFTAIGSVAELNQKGQISKKINGQPVAVVRSPNNAKALLAVNSTCTHKGCTVDWQKADKAFVCPCHSAKFASDGAVLKAPATKPLKTYKAKIVGDQVLVKVG
jgi:cytochrome b6-f complex iron-sulfur subunit